MLTPKGMLQRPLSVLSYMVDYAVHGDRVAGFHLANLVIHGVNTVLVYLLASERFAAPLVAGLVFGLHPLATACVSQIFGRNYSLATMFFLVGLVCVRAMACPSDGAAGRGRRRALPGGRPQQADVRRGAASSSPGTRSPRRTSDALALDRLGASWWAVVGAAGATWSG